MAEMKAYQSLDDDDDQGYSYQPCEHHTEDQCASQNQFGLFRSAFDILSVRKNA